MSLRIRWTVQAKRDIDRHFVRIGVEDITSAEKLLEAIRAAAKGVASYPQIGSARTFHSGRLRGARMWPVPGFEKYLIFYQITEDSILILRVLHSAQDYTRLSDSD